MYDGTPEVEIAQQREIAGQLSLRHRKIDGGERLAFRGRWAGNYRGVDRLEALHVIEPGSERSKFLGGRFVRIQRIDDQGVGRRVIRNGLDLFQQSF